MKAWSHILTAWIIAYYGTDYQGIINLLNSLSTDQARAAKIFTCNTLDGEEGHCVAYNDNKTSGKY